MSTKRYFDLLGIAPTKNEKIIKRAYRKLAMKYHPDRNPTPQAKSKFIQITEAYDNILLALNQANNSTSTQNKTTRTRQRSYTNQQRTSYNRHTTTQNKKREERVKAARERYERMKRQEEEQNEKYFQKMTSGRMWFLFKSIVIMCSFLSFIITVDFLYLPTKNLEATIVKSNINIEYSGKNGVDTSPVLFNNGQKAWVPYSIINRDKRHFLFLERTFILKDIKYVKYWKKNKWHYYVPDYSLIDSFPWVPIILLFPMFTYFIRDRNIFFSACYHATLYIWPIILLITLISNDRWAHIITLGIL